MQQPSGDSAKFWKESREKHNHGSIAEVRAHLVETAALRRARSQAKGLPLVMPTQAQVDEALYSLGYKHPPTNVFRVQADALPRIKK